MDRNTVVALSVLATLAAACSDDVSEGATTPGDPSSHQASDSSGVRAPESGWVREATADRARALGLPARTIARYVGEDGVLPLGFKLQQQTYAIYVMDDAGDASTYDIGGYSYDDHGRIMLSSSSARCSDCDTALGWQQDGDRMVIDEVSGPRATPLDQLVWEGAWTEYTGD